MSNRKNSSRKSPTNAGGRGWVIAAVVALAGVALTVALWNQRRPGAADGASGGSTNQPPTAVTPAAPASPPVSIPSAAKAVAPDALPRLEVKQAVMVTVELDFGPIVPSVADALQQIERRHQPEDGTGRVFSVIDAYGEPTADGRKLHLSMHVSTEKTGVGTLVFRRTGEKLWSSRIIPTADGTKSVSPSGLTILLPDAQGRVLTVDGSGNPPTILQAWLKETGVPVTEAWPDGAEREVTFLYSACGCPVKAMCRRVGDRTVRTKDTPVLFPDDPAAVSVIRTLMAW